MNSERDNDSDDRLRKEAIDSGDTKEHGDKAHAQEKRLDNVRDFTAKDSEFAAERQKKAETVDDLVSRDISINPEKRFDNVKDFQYVAERQKKAEIVEGMVTRDFPVNPEKRLDNAKDFHYDDAREFGNELEKRDPTTTEEDKRLTGGFHDGSDNQSFVKDEGDTFKTSIHEKLHQKSKSELPIRMNEGVTEYLARQEAGPWGELKNIDSQGREIPQTPSDYEKEVETISKLSALAGDANIHAAYFDGKTEQLRGAVDSELGEGSFQKVTDALERKDYKTADETIDKYHKK